MSHSFSFRDLIEKQQEIVLAVGLGHAIIPRGECSSEISRLEDFVPAERGEAHLVHDSHGDGYTVEGAYSFVYLCTNRASRNECTMQMIDLADIKLEKPLINCFWRRAVGRGDPVENRQEYKTT